MHLRPAQSSGTPDLGILAPRTAGETGAFASSRSMRDVRQPDCEISPFEPAKALDAVFASSAGLHQAVVIV